jgi:hypothetical protein
MSLRAELALRSAIRRAALNDPAVAAAVNSSFYDGATRDAVFPFITFGDVSLRDWSTGSDRGLEHQFTLEIWSMQPGNGEVLKLADLVQTFLQSASLSLQGFVLVDLRFVWFEARRESNGRFAKGRMRFRAITEESAGGDNGGATR